MRHRQQGKTNRSRQRAGAYRPPRNNGNIAPIYVKSNTFEHFVKSVLNLCQILKNGVFKIQPYNQRQGGIEKIRAYFFKKIFLFFKQNYTHGGIKNRHIKRSDVMKRKLNISPCNRKKCPYYNTLLAKCKDCDYNKNGNWKQSK